ncbi:MAG: hypothetical protein JNM66_19360 [Bryobacterales bacterium]|nr:hypothetical protein [Bryobacterales bacterium]
MRHVLLVLSITPAIALSLQEALDRGLSAEGLRAQAVLKPNTRLFLQMENGRFWGIPSFVYPRDEDSFLYASQVIETGRKRSMRTAFAESIRNFEQTVQYHRDRVRGRREDSDHCPPAPFSYRGTNRFRRPRR